MSQAARYAYFLLAISFVLGLAVQVFLAGLGLFVDRTASGGPNFANHIILGWVLHIAPILVLLAAALSRAGRKHWLWALLLAVVVFIVPVLATMRAEAPVVAAFHPVLAVVAFGIALMVARNSIGALRAPVPERARIAAE